MTDNTENDEPKEKEHEEEFGEEFDFDSDQHEDILAPHEDEGESQASESDIPVEAPPKHKSIFVPLLIGLAVIGFIGWKVFGMLGKKEEPKVEPETVKIQPKVEPAPAPITTALPKTDIPNISQAQEQAKFASSEEKVTALIQKKLDQQTLAQKQQLDVLQKDLATSNQNLAQANRIIASLQHDVSTLGVAVQDLNTQLRAIRQEQLNLIAKEAEAKAKKAVKPKKISHKSEAYSSPALTIHAIIPGRAWIRTKEGKTITVTEGDPIGEYGKVLKIDAPNGIVITTSGVTLR